jgi:MSHA biogenesis protein MshM
MPAETLEALRLVTNLETEKFKLLQVVLFGQPELDIILQQPGFRQLLQRVTFSYQLQPLVASEVEHYLMHRLVTAGYSGPELFDKKAITTLSNASKGIPRLVNILAHKSMMCAFGKQQKKITKQFVLAAIEDTESVSCGHRAIFNFHRKVVGS